MKDYFLLDENNVFHFDDKAKTFVHNTQNFFPLIWTRPPSPLVYQAGLLINMEPSYYNLLCLISNV